MNERSKCLSYLFSPESKEIQEWSKWVDAEIHQTQWMNEIKSPQLHVRGNGYRIDKLDAEILKTYGY